MTSKLSSVLGIVATSMGWLGWFMTRDHRNRITTDFASGSAGDQITKGAASGLLKIIAVPLAIGALICALIAIIVGLRALFSKTGGKVGAIIGLGLSSLAIYLAIGVFAVLK